VFSFDEERAARESERCGRGRIFKVFRKEVSDQIPPFIRPFHRADRGAEIFGGDIPRKKPVKTGKSKEELKGEIGMGGDEKELEEWMRRIDERLKRIARQMEMGEIAEYIQLLNRPRRLILINIVAGIARGVGIAIGVTLFTATIIYGLQKLGALNLPIIGDFIAEIVKIVQAQLELDGIRY
jgi:hypothetical protein